MTEKREIHKNAQREELKKSLRVLRALSGMSRRELAKTTGLSLGLIARFEQGETLPEPQELKAIAAAAKVPVDLLWEEIPTTLRAWQTLGDDRGEDVANLRELDEVTHEIANETARVLARVGRILALYAFAEEKKATTGVPEQPDADRSEARALWARLGRVESRHWFVVIQTAREFQSWALCELVCDESARAVGDNVGRSLQLANLAVRISELVDGNEAWRSGLQGYAWGFVGNARRVPGNFAGAERAFERSRQLWRIGGGAAGKVLDRARLLSLEASLRRGQKKHKEALDLLDQALAIDKGQRRVSLLLTKVAVCEYMDNYEGALEVLSDLGPLLERETDPRLLLGYRFNLGAALCHLGRAEEASEVVEQVKELALQQGNRIDLVRVGWLEGKLAWGLGDKQKAISLLRQVRRDFQAADMAHDADLVTAELSGLLVETGRRPR
jgi:transcriptional regulator with XRE-family HTH domain